MNTVTMALLGKGGVGKTVLSALIGRAFASAGARTLLVDADPARGLTISLGVGEVKTIGEVRDEIITRARAVGSEEDKEEIAEIVDYLLLEALYEAPSFSLLSMGSTTALGCYCPLNTLLRATMKAIGTMYDVIVIDAEAGIEQVNRQVVETVEYPLIVTDNSMRGVTTSLMIRDILARVPGMRPVATGVIFNRVTEESPALIAKVTNGGLAHYGSLPPDPAITSLDLNGEPLFSIADTAPSLVGIKSILAHLQLLPTIT